MGCGALVRAEDSAGVMIPLTSSAGGTAAIEVLDPLCASCKAFDARLAASALGERLDLRGVLFPLDSACNWMVTEAVHPGACAVSEAVLCAGPRGAQVLAWALRQQEDLRARGSSGPAAVYARIKSDFPELAACVDKPAVKARINKSLRWIVANSLPVLTPQLFVRNQKLPDEDTDLGLDYVLSRVLAQGAGGDKP